MRCDQYTCSNPSIYKKGVWAEVVVEKKSLPATKTEFVDFLMFYNECGEGTTIRNFLDNYKD
jgi:hypothetical protein